MSSSANSNMRAPLHIPLWSAFCAFAAIALFFLWTEHGAHLLGALPYVLVLLCPLVHLFMHRGHQGHGADRVGDERHTDHR